MRRAFTILLTVLVVGGIPVSADALGGDGIQVDVETSVAEAHVDTSGTTGGTSVSISPENASEANDTVQADASSGDEEAHVQARATEGQVNVSVSPTTIPVRLDDGQILELTYTPRDAVADASPDAEMEEDEAEPQAAESAPSPAPAEDDGDGTELAWAFAPATGLAAAVAVSQVSPVGRFFRRLVSTAPLAPLYSRIGRQELLDHESRAAIYELLEEAPGLSLEQICERLELARSTARHHVRKLEQAEMIEHTRVGRSRLHHLVGQRHRAVREHLLTHDTRRAVYEAVEGRARTITEIAEAIDANPGSVHFHLGKLEEAGLVEATGEEGRRYRARDSEGLAVTFEPV